jgi:DNA repair exonuclease SbcCD nuclease subunit
VGAGGEVRRSKTLFINGRNQGVPCGRPTQESGDHVSEKRESAIDRVQDGIITIVLTANNHLGYTSFVQQPRKREERQQRLRRAFQQATDFAVEQGVDFFIQAGDLFDTPTPGERDRSFVAARLAQLRQAGVRVFALSGVRDTPVDAHTLLGEVASAPQISYARLGALHYLPPTPTPQKGCKPMNDELIKQEPAELEPTFVDVRGTLVGICGLGVVAGQEGDPLVRVLEGDDNIERAAIRLLVLHAPIEGLETNVSLLDTRSQVSRSSIARQTAFRYIVGGYHHGYQHLHIGQCDVIIAGTTQHIDFRDRDSDHGFVFIGLAADGIRWCNHIGVDALSLQRLVIHTTELWRDDTNLSEQSPTDIILERLRPLCSPDTMVQLRLEGELTRRQYHQLDLNQIRRYGEEHCFALAIDDSALLLLPVTSSAIRGDEQWAERFSPREELVAVADEWIAEALDEQEKKALRVTKEELLAAMDEAPRGDRKPRVWGTQ